MSISNLNIQCLNSKRTSKYPPPYLTLPNHTTPFQTKQYQRGGGGWGKRSKSSKVPGSQHQGPRVTFKYELDSKEGPSCCDYNLTKSFCSKPTCCINSKDLWHNVDSLPIWVWLLTGQSRVGSSSGGGGGGLENNEEGVTETRNMRGCCLILGLPQVKKNTVNT